MARKARRKSSTDIYHVILRGINRQQIFYDEEDYNLFIRLMKRFQKVSNYKIYAYCLMGNHIHLLLKASDESLETIFRRIGPSFAYWYNLKYQRVGHLFQDRFKSEAVEDEGYFLTVLRYILRNPVKAGLCSSPWEYAYSNAKDFLGEEKPLLPCSRTGDELASFINMHQDDQCLDISESTRQGITDAAAEKLILREFGSIIPTLNAENRVDVEMSIQHLYAKGASIRQISRLTGISKSIVERALGKGT